MSYIGIDIGGTWIKGAIVDERFFGKGKLGKSEYFQIEKIKSPLHTKATVDELLEALNNLITILNVNKEKIDGIGISTAGIVNYHGEKILKASDHYNVLKNDNWKSSLEEKYKCSVSLINDADAATIGLAEKGYLTGDNTVGIMPIGTGLGFSVWRNGRRWQPGKTHTLLGSIRTMQGSFNNIASASRLASFDKENNLLNVLLRSEFKEQRDTYFHNIIKIINSAALLYTLNEIIICGGLVDAANTCNFPLGQVLCNLLKDNIPVELDRTIKITIAKEGNSLQLSGALALAKGESIASRNKIIHPYKSLETEIPYSEDLQLQKMHTSDIINTLWQAEQEAGDLMQNTLPIISSVIDMAIEKVRKGGRIIYAGAGASGRLAAEDAIELPCTYGFPEDRALSIIAGGITDASIEVESDFEEDASAIPEILLLNIQSNDIIIGISASGTAYYVQSALAFAKSRGALSVMIQNKLPDIELPFCDFIIPLNSGNEVVSGSTRMKAGTATKKILNFISSTIMIKLGKVTGTYMTDVACINNKLVERAQSILKILYNIEKDEAMRRLEMADMNLGKVITDLTTNNDSQ
jgi:N-acetylmuramic acid 6-phosphate etherase